MPLEILRGIVGTVELINSKYGTVGWMEFGSVII